MPNPFNYLDEDEKAQAARYNELLAAERYWRDCAIAEFRKGLNRNLHKVHVLQARVRFFYQLRIKEVIY